MALRTVDEVMDLFAEIPWFDSIGDVTDRSVDKVSSWEEAETYVSPSIVWLNFRNAIWGRVNDLAEETFSLDDVEPLQIDLQKRVRKMMRRKPFTDLDKYRPNPPSSGKVGSSFKYHVEWDLKGIGLEYLCQDELPPVFYIPKLLPIYQAGNLPCGWRGTMIKSRWMGNGPEDLPKGRIRVL